MSGLYVKLDVEYASDDKMIAAGPLGELLYIRSLAFCKKNPTSDGKISLPQLAHVGVGIPNLKRHAGKLVEVGAWTSTKTGWTITAWLKRNRSSADIQAQLKMASDLGVQGNHDRWHTGDNGKPSAKCVICVAQHHTTRSGTPIPTPSGNPIGGSSPKEEEETEEEPKPEEKPETEPKPITKGSSSKPDDGSGTQPPNAAAAALKYLFDHRMKSAKTPGLAITLKSQLPDEWRTPIADFLDKRPTASAEEIASVVLGVPGLTYAPVEVKQPWYADPHCEACGGDGWATRSGTANELAPCTCRQPEPHIATVHPIRPAG